MEKDFVIFDVAWMINTQLRERDKQNSIKACYTLLKFCYEKKMIINNPLRWIKESLINDSIMEFVYRLCLDSPKI